MKIRLTGTYTELQDAMADLAKVFPTVTVLGVYPVYGGSHPGCLGPVPDMARVDLEVTR